MYKVIYRNLSVAFNTDMFYNTKATQLSGFGIIFSLILYACRFVRHEPGRSSFAASGQSRIAVALLLLYFR